MISKEGVRNSETQILLNFIRQRSALDQMLDTSSTTYTEFSNSAVRIFPDPRIAQKIGGVMD